MDANTILISTDGTRRVIKKANKKQSKRKSKWFTNNYYPKNKSKGRSERKGKKKINTKETLHDVCFVFVYFVFDVTYGAIH